MPQELNGPNSSKQSSQPPSPPFSAIWETLLQLLLVLLFTPSLLHFKLHKFLLTPLQLGLHSLKGGKGERGGVVFAGGREMKIFSTLFRDFGKYGRETVFSTLDGAGNYWKKRDINIGNHKKRYFDIWTSF